MLFSAKEAYSRSLRILLVLMMIHWRIQDLTLGGGRGLWKQGEGVENRKNGAQNESRAKRAKKKRRKFSVLGIKNHRSAAVRGVGRPPGSASVIDY